MYAADLHVHSRFAYGTSRALDLAEMSRWARLKGIDLLATGDFTHPEWIGEISGQLEDLGTGFYRYGGVRFVLGAEVSSICRLGGRARRVHLLIFAPSLQSAAAVNCRLARFGRLDADGRPSVRISPGELCHLLHDVDPLCFVVPAHPWTPWFGAFGERSGFDSLKECFGDAVPLVPAVETGLSADPFMAWAVPSLDNVAIVSFSDAHSGANLGRELTVFSGEPGFEGLLGSLRRQSIVCTIESHPAAGKYHDTGHRSCGYRSAGGISSYGLCPGCGRKPTIGVSQRVRDMAGRVVRTWTGEDGYIHGDTRRPPYRHVVGLIKVIAESLGMGPKSRRVQAQYLRLVNELGGELEVLLRAPLADIDAVAPGRIAEGVGRVRSGSGLLVDPGYDGIPGSVRVWPPQNA